MLIIFIIPAVLIFHDLWNMEGPERKIEQIIFMKDIAILGCLLAFATISPGKYAFND